MSEFNPFSDAVMMPSQRSRQATSHPWMRMGGSDSPSTEPRNIVMEDGSRIGLNEAMGNGFSGAKNNSERRGYVVFPELDTRKEINAENRTAILTKSRWLYNNNGYAKRIVRGVARMIGAMMPQPNTGDREWNALAKKVWKEATGSPEAFDVARKYSVMSYQLNLNRLWLRDGDSLTVFADTGDSTQIKCYEAHQIKNPIGEALNKTKLRGAARQWIDGAYVGKDNESLAYRVRHPDDHTRGTTFQAHQCHLYTQYERPGQARGMGCLHHAVNGMLDTQEMKNDVTLGIKTANLLGFYLTKKDPEGMNLPGNKGMQRDLRKVKVQERKADGSEGEDGDETNDEYVNVEDVMKAGQMPKWDGWEPGVLHDARPNENHLALWRWTVREIALGLDFPPEVLWEMGADLNGNVVRVLNEETQETIDSLRMELLIPFMQKLWFAVIGGAIDRGELAEPKVAKGMERYVGWWTVDWIPPKRKTIDRGKEGKLNLDERRAMLRTLDRHFSEQQSDWTDEVSQWMDEFEMIDGEMEKRGWTDEHKKMVQTMLLAPPAGTGNFEVDDSGDDEVSDKDREKIKEEKENGDSED